MYRGSCLIWEFMKVYALQVLSHLDQPSFPPSFAEDSHEVEGRQAHNYKCNNFQEIDVPGEALALKFSNP